MTDETSRPGSRRWSQRPWRLRDRRIRTKLAIILAIPLLVILVLTTLTVASTATAARRAGQAHELVALGHTAGELAAQLQRERSAVALVFAEDSSKPMLEEYRSQVAATDMLATKFQTASESVRPPAGLDELLRRIAGQLTGLNAIREQVQSAPEAVASAIVFQYRAVIADLISYRQGLSQVSGDAQTANNLRANAALSKAIESLGLMQVAVIQAIDVGWLTPAAQQEIVAADAGFNDSSQAFAQLAPQRWQSALNDRVNGPEVLKAERLQGVVAHAEPGNPLRIGTGPGWASALAARMDLMHSVEHDLDRELLSDVARQRDEQQRTIVTLSATVVAAVAVMVLIGWWVARSLSRSLTTLRRGAEEVAAHRLPRMVQQLDINHTDPAAINRLVVEAAEPIKIEGTDEVGQVAAAFNSVSASAVRVAGEQAALRAAVAGIFVSVSRRLQRRADRMMVSLDGLERDEQDPERLRGLFELDHVATLIRRLIASLHVLAGSRAGRPTGGPVPLPDLLRAAGQEIEDYQRVELGEVDSTVQITADAAEELIHLLAELLDNAAKFSPPDAPVVIEGHRVGDLLHIQVRDTGTGMREAELRKIRERVANPRRFDLTTTQQMGIPVVGGIAERLGIKVEFRSVWERETRVDLTVPAILFTTVPIDTAAPTAELPTITVEAKPTTTAADQTAPPAPAAPGPLHPGPRRSWFTVDAARTAPGSNQQVPKEWQVAAAAAEAARTAVPAETTENGLPVRQPGQRVIPGVGVSTRPHLPIPRQPDQMRRQMAAFQTGLNAAGRHTPQVLVKDTAE
ncbi:MAG TPA: nitrate- and nitrite sensing domain-containing protein [Micromonosporaceae bacterium]|nr:nitrate- and nitrite sensing domain-containing protein [Micromonosporaceae bacterium]